MQISNFLYVQHIIVPPYPRKGSYISNYSQKVALFGIITVVIELLFDVIFNYRQEIKFLILQCQNNKGMRTFLLLILLQVGLTISCIHDQITKGAKLTPINDYHSPGRFLQSTDAGGLRIYFYYNTTDISKDDPKGLSITKIMNIVASFWQNTIQVQQRLALSFNVASSVDRNNFFCLSFKVPKQLIENQVPNKDFGVLVEAKDDGDNGITAYSFPCAYSLTQKRPLWGLMHWNKNYIAMDPLSFQQNINIAIHQVTHILGFSSLLFSIFPTNPQINVSGTTYLTGPRIKQQLQRQYGCDDPIGMPLESAGGSGTALSHWSRKVANNELMTPSVSQSNPTISYITLALLAESGWYKNVFRTYAQYINFGYREGCQFIKPQNCSAPQYCTKQGELQCDYDHVALGYCKKDIFSPCPYVKYYSNFICIDPNYQKSSLHSAIVSQTGEKGGKYSRCFNSNLITKGSRPSKYSFRCYETLCSPSRRTLTIRVGNRYGICIFPNQKITIPGYDGFLTCPKSFFKACAIVRCPNQCNANGICLNGKCLCEKQYTGQSCAEVSSVGFASKIVPFYTKQNNNCQKGTYLSQFGNCQLCPYKCAKCNKNQCLVCFGDKLPVDQKCT